MGCCLGTAAVNHRRPPKHAASQSPPFEEETVKEVLSETPIVPKVEIAHPTQNGVVDLTENLTVEVKENVSEISEMYSYSESFSAATTATTMTTAADNKKDEIEIDDEDEVTQKVKNKSPPAKKVLRKRPMVSSGELPARKERGNRPMARRHVAPSTENKRRSPSRTTTTTPRNRNVGPNNESRREVTARRSRSPAVRGDTCQRRKVRENSPPGKAGELLPVAAVESEGKCAAEKTGEGGVSPARPSLPEAEVPASESLENPLVSLECFIFL